MRYRGLSIFVFTLLLITGCGTSVSPTANTTVVATNPPMVAGFWEDKQVPVALCGGIAQVGITLDIHQEQKSSNLTGTLTLKSSSDSIELPFSGQIDDAGEITGRAPIVWTENGFRIESKLILKNSQLEGTFTDVNPYKCKAGGSSKAVMTVALEKETDVLEPNNELTQAGQLEFGKEYSLITRSNDPDWFVFTLSSSQIVTFSYSGSGPWGFTFTLMDSQQNVIIDMPNALTFDRVMQPGQYYIKVQGVSGKANYQLKVETRDLPDMALEPNNTPKQATSVDLTSPTNLYVFSDDQDWLTFTLQEVHEIEVSFVEKNVSVTLFNEQLETLADVPMHMPFQTILNPGKYYFKIVSADPTDEGGFDYSVAASKLTPLGRGDPEPNNTFEQAMNISLNTDYRDYYLADNDKDWVSFTLTKTSVVAFNSSLNLNLFELKNGGLVQVQGDLYGVFPLMLYPGTYYLELSFSSSIPYDITVFARDLPDLAYEPNNSLSEAVPFMLNAPRAEFVVDRDDDDWFKFTLANPSSISFEIGSFEVNVSLYAADGNPIAIESSEPSSFIQAFDSGTYYLKISPMYGYSFYTLRLMTE